MESVPGQGTPDPSGGAVEDGEHSGLQPKELLLFAGRAVRQNLALSIITACIIALVGSTAVSAMPLVYDATFKIFVQEGGSVTSSLASGRDRNTPIDAARGLQEYILARDNLLSIVREAKLVDGWAATRALPMRLKDQLIRALLGPPSRPDMERVFVEMLSTSITASMEGSSVGGHAQWRSGKGAYDIARLVQRNFLAARASHDFGPIQRAIPFLEAQLEESDKNIESAAAALHSRSELVHADDPKKGLAGVVVPAELAKSGGGSMASLLELASISRRLSETRRKQRELTGPWQQRIAALKAELVDAKASYSDDHPKVMQLEARIAAASEVPEELAALRATEAELRTSMASIKPARPAGDSAANGDAGVAGSDVAEVDVTNDEETALAPLRVRFMNALRRSEEIAQRLETARIELAAAQADFEHRYVVIAQPELPDKPLKNKKPILFPLVFVAAILLGIAAAVGRELMKDRIVESWQARSLGLPLLAEVELGKLPPPQE